MSKINLKLHNFIKEKICIQNLKPHQGPMYVNSSHGTLRYILHDILDVETQNISDAFFIIISYIVASV